MENSKLECLARIAHEVNRAWCIYNGDTTQVSWESAPENIKQSAIQGVVGAVLDNNTPEQSHNSWLEFKKNDGWVFGSVKDLNKKEHPCMVPYDQLPESQRVKDEIFVEVVRTVARIAQFDK